MLAHIQLYSASQICYDSFKLSSEINYLKYFPFSSRYEPSMIHKILNKLNNPKYPVSHSNEFLFKFCYFTFFYSSISFKISKIPSHFGFKINFFFFLKSILNKNWCGIYFIKCSFCNLDYHG